MRLAHSLGVAVEDVPEEAITELKAKDRISQSYKAAKRRKGILGRRRRKYKGLEVEKQSHSNDVLSE